MEAYFTTDYIHSKITLFTFKSFLKYIFLFIPLIKTICYYNILSRYLLTEMKNSASSSMMLNMATISIA